MVPKLSDIQFVWSPWQSRWINQSPSNSATTEKSAMLSRFHRVQESNQCLSSFSLHRNIQLPCQSQTTKKSWKVRALVTYGDLLKSMWTCCWIIYVRPEDLTHIYLILAMRVSPNVNQVRDIFSIIELSRRQKQKRTIASSQADENLLSKLKFILSRVEWMFEMGKHASMISSKNITWNRSSMFMRELDKNQGSIVENW